MIEAFEDDYSGALIGTNSVSYDVACQVEA